MSNDDVCRLWAASKAGKTEHMETNGKILWSYWLPIGFTSPTGGKFVLDWTRNGYGFKSMTTSHHVSTARKFGRLVNPSVATVEGGRHFVVSDVTVQTALFTLKLSARY